MIMDSNSKTLGANDSGSKRSRSRGRRGAADAASTPLVEAFGVAADWAFNVACDLAQDFPEDVRTIERVRSFVRARMGGQPAHVRTEDVLFAFGLVLGAVGRDMERDASRAEHVPHETEETPQPPRFTVPAVLRVSVGARELLALYEAAAASNCLRTGA